MLSGDKAERGVFGVRLRVAPRFAMEHRFQIGANGAPNLSSRRSAAEENGEALTEGRSVSDL